MQKIMVVGSTGSGKTTLARGIAERLGIKHIELDECFWGPSWTEIPTDEFRERVRAALPSEAWVTCGNYHSKLRDITWAEADTIVWLDLPKIVSFTRLLWRTVSRAISRTPLWNGNRESIRLSFLSKDSILLWWWTVQKQEPDKTLRRVEATSANVVRLKSPRQVRGWLANLSTDSPSRGETNSSNQPLEEHHRR